MAARERAFVMTNREADLSPSALASLRLIASGMGFKIPTLHKEKLLSMRLVTADRPGFLILTLEGIRQLDRMDSGL
jgi:hypothetical protein